MNRRGQAVLESILILVAFFAVTSAIGASFRQNELFSGMISAPWERLAGMLENGVWLPRNQGRALHPNHHLRHISIKGDSPR